MASKVSALSTLAAADLDVAADYLYVVDTSAGSSGSKKMTTTALLTDRTFTGTLTWAGSSGANLIAAPDNLANALSIVQGANAYVTIVTTDSAERVLLSKQTKLADSVKLAFGDGDDITVAWDGTDLDVLQAAANSSIKWGVSGAGIDQVWYGDTAGADMTWDQSADTLIMGDAAKVAFGAGSDIVVSWDGTDLDVTQAAANSSIKWGVSGAGIDHVFYGDTAGADMTWDQSADSLILGDAAKLALGTGSDITVAWDGTDLDILQAAVNSSIKWGIDGAGIDQVWYGDTASTNMTWDQSADSLIMNGAARIVWTGTTGQPEMHLTDNLADALSVEVSGGPDLLVLTTTNDAESVQALGLRKTQSTAVAITGATTLKLSDSGGVFTIDQDAAFDIDLPSPTTGPGCEYTFVITDAGANDVTITVAGDAATFVGTIVNDITSVLPATGGTLTFANGVAAVGDTVVVRSLATNLYLVQAVSSADGGITVA